MKSSFLAELNIKKIKPIIMRNIILLLSLFLITTSTFAQYTLSGIITDESGEALIGASVAAYQKTVFIKGTLTDIDGRYELLLEEGDYTLEVSYTGFSPLRNSIKLKKNKALDLKLGSAGVVLEESVVIGGYGVSKKSRKKASKAASSYDMSTIPMTGISHSSTRIASSPSDMKIVKTDATIESGQLTAGEWKDLDNWGFWEKLKSDEAYSKWQKHWGFFPNDRYAVHITNEAGRPVANCVVQLIQEDDTVLWTSRTDNQGRAELWANLYGQDAKDNLRLNIIHQDKKSTWTTLKRFTDEGIGHYTISTDCTTPETVDILFAVDATSSMDDEIQYLKAELLDVINRVKEDNSLLNLRWGSVFYRDSTDEYLTRVSPFSDDAQQMIDFIKAQQSGGGGDYPEAVDEALDVALAQDWSDDARARILFLLLDAPPHEGTATNKRLQKAIKKAAEKGIKIIPVTASGIHKDTEFLMKYFAVATNGTYVFLTDHSGIGNPHLAPTAEEYNVENLNDLLVRVITENTEMVACQDWTPTIVQDVTPIDHFTPPTPKQLKRDKDLLQEVVIYPNPAETFLFVSLKEKFDRLSVIATNGTLLWDYTELEEGTYNYNVETLTAGTYYIRFQKENKTITTSFIVVKD